MDVQQTRTVISNLEKATDNKSRLELLNVLNDEVHATERFLRKTKVGVAVNKLRTSSDPEVRTLVKKIIKKWKEEVTLEKKKKKHEVKKEVKKEVKTEVKAEVKPEIKHTTSGKVGGTFVTTKTRTPVNDGVRINFYDNTTRNGSITGLYTALAIESSSQPEEIVEAAKRIEKAVFGMTTKDSKIADPYRNKMRSLIMNLRNKKNPELRIKVVSGELRPERFVNMTNKELAPESLKKLMDDMHQKNLFDAQGAVQKRAVTDRFVCSRCKKREVSYYQMQTRSADEPLTTFCTCENCGLRWKFC